MISIYFENNINIRIDCTRDILSELNEYFSFFSEGYRFHPLFKQKRWDGKVRLFNVNTGTINRGLLSRVIQFCDDRDYKYTVDSKLNNSQNLSLEVVNEFIDSLNFSSKGNPISLYDYQREAIHKCLTEKRVLVNSPTSSGKSSIVAGIARYLQTKFDTTKKIVIIVPNVSLVNQFAYDFCDYFSRDVDWLKSDPVHTIFSGKEKETDSPIIVTTYQSLLKLDKNWFKSVGCLIVDECHGADGKSLRKICDMCTEAEYRFGFTGSLKKSKVHVLTLEGVFGPTHTTITTRELIDNEQVTDIDIKALLIEYPEDFRKQMRKINDYGVENETIISNEKRNKFISKLAISQSGNGLILVNLVEKHAKPLYDMISNMTDRPVYLIVGEVSGTEREEIRLKMEQETDAIIVASYSTLSTGVNIPSLKWLVFGSSMKSYVKVIQSIGRVLRKHKSKNKVVLFDIVDDLRVKLRVNTHENYLFKHFMERLGHYQEQKFNCEIKKIPLFTK